MGVCTSKMVINFGIANPSQKRRQIKSSDFDEMNFSEINFSILKRFSCFMEMNFRDITEEGERR